MLPPFAIFVFHGAHYGTWLIDDAGISYAYARNLAAGLGLVAQEGHAPVEGFSNPLWTFLISVLLYLKLFSVPYVPKIIAGILVLGAFVTFAASMLQILPRNQALTVAALGLAMTAGNPGFTIWCVSGLENPLLALLGASLLYTSLRAMQADEKDLGALCIRGGLIAAALALTRPDALLYVAALPMARLLRMAPLSIRALARCALQYGLSAGVPAGAYALFRRTYFHDWLPNTYYAKPGALLRSPLEAINPWGGGANRFSDLATGLFQVLPILAVIVPAAAFIRAGYSWSSATARKTVLLGVFVVLAFVSYVVLPGDWMHEYRFATIAFPTTYLLTFLILQQILAANQRIHSPSAILACAGVAALVAVAPGFAVRSQVFAAHPAAPLESVAQSSYRYDALADGLKLDHPSILLPDLGGALLLSRMRVVDLAGLCDRQFGRMRFEHREPQVLAEHILRNVKPDLVRIRGYWAIRSGLLKSEEFARTYLSLGDGDFVRRTSLPREMGDDAALSIKEGVKRLVRVDIHLRLNTALRLGR